jgi:hypothetical protein
MKTNGMDTQAFLASILFEDLTLMIPWGLALTILSIATVGLQLAWSLRVALGCQWRQPMPVSPPYLSSSTVCLYVRGADLSATGYLDGLNHLAQSRGAAFYLSSWKFLAALPLTRIKHRVSRASSSFLRHINWRGIPYRLERAGRVRLLEYRPFRRSGWEAVANDSLV